MGQGGQGACRARPTAPGTKQTRNFLGARYKEDPVTKELTMDPKIRVLELVLVRNTPPHN